MLFGIPDDDIEYPEIVAPPKENNETTSYIDVNCSNTEDDRLGKTNPLSASKTHWGEDSKRDSYVFQKPEENSAGYINERAD